MNRPQCFFSFTSCILEDMCTIKWSSGRVCLRIWWNSCCANTLGLRLSVTSKWLSAHTGKNFRIWQLGNKTQPPKGWGECVQKWVYQSYPSLGIIAGCHRDREIIYWAHRRDGEEVWPWIDMRNFCSAKARAKPPRYSNIYSYRGLEWAILSHMCITKQDL